MATPNNATRARSYTPPTAHQAEATFTFKTTDGKQINILGNSLNGNPTISKLYRNKPDSDELNQLHATLISRQEEAIAQLEKYEKMSPVKQKEFAKDNGGVPTGQFELPVTLTVSLVADVNDVDENILNAI